MSDVCADNNTLADPNNGPYATTGPNAVSGVQLSHRESRLRQIGDSVANIADLRIKRAQIQDKALLRAGETASTATARKALAAARAANNKVKSLAHRSGAMARKGGGGKKVAPQHCYWCNKVGHYGRNCPDKKKGEPPTPDSKAGKDRAKKKAKKKK